MDGLANMTDGYHYTACGLDYVYLLNGYTERETPHGSGISIRDARRLHEVIARAVITSGRRLRGQEVRFLRGMMHLSQEGLARVLGQRRGSVARWEMGHEKAIPGAADRALRLFSALKLDGHETAVELVNLLTELDEIEHKIEALWNMRLQETNNDWKIAA
jgi:DNA-binding transcriptional regulator YiaG